MESLLIICIVGLPLVYVVRLVFKGIEHNQTIIELDRMQEYLSGPPQSPPQTLDILKNLYVTYEQTLSPYRIGHLDFYEFSELNDSLHLFSTLYKEYQQASILSRTLPIPLKDFINLQTP